MGDSPPEAAIDRSPEWRETVSALHHAVQKGKTARAEALKQEKLIKLLR